jgi:hypothetical protein
VLLVRYELDYVLLQLASISQLTVSRLSRECGILDVSQPSRPVNDGSFTFANCYWFAKKIVAWSARCDSLRSKIGILVLGGGGHEMISSA